jgi:hypothetical protein
MARIDKLIVTNHSVLARKYVRSLRHVMAAVRDLIDADARRDVTTALVALDDPRAMRRYRVRPVERAEDCKQNKEAIDGLYHAVVPDYLMILGAIDVVPHQDLQNPLYSADLEAEESDSDYHAWGDLPYACDEPYGREIARFRRPTRIVGRLPDVTGGSDARYLVRLLTLASGYRSRPRDQYRSCFGISALAWEASSALSMKNLFGDADDLVTSPRGDSHLAKAAVRRRTHFFNCHGAEADTSFYGEDPKTGDQPVALDARYLAAARRISEGTVVAAECCYGAELFDPSASGQLGICNTYLRRGAYGFFGSSTTSWGPEEGNGQADLICQYFLERVLRGASLGRAALEARQRFVQSAGVLEPQDLKTLAQFSLMGDPSVQPVERAPHALQSSRAYREALDGPQEKAGSRAQRRAWLVRYGSAIGDATGGTRRERRRTASPRLRSVMERALREVGARPRDHSSHRVVDPEERRIGAELGRRRKPTLVHVAIGSTGRRRHVAGRNVAQLVAVVATVENGRVIGMRRLHSR